MSEIVQLDMFEGMVWKFWVSLPVTKLTLSVGLTCVWRRAGDWQQFWISGGGRECYYQRCSMRGPECRGHWRDLPHARDGWRARHVRSREPERNRGG